MVEMTTLLTKTNLRIASWNVLAQRYALTERYKYAGAAMDPKARRSRIIKHAAQLSASHDVVVLCEVEEDLAADITEAVAGSTHFSGGGAGVMLISGLGGTFDDMAMFGKRVAWVDIECSGVSVRVIGVHLRWCETGRLARSSWNALERRVVTPRSVLAGDINLSFSEIGAGPQWQAHWLENSAYVDGDWLNLDVIAANFGAVTGMGIDSGEQGVIPSATWPSDHLALSAKIHTGG
jgi:hypothetical protein